MAEDKNYNGKEKDYTDQIINKIEWVERYSRERADHNFKLIGFFAIFATAVGGLFTYDYVTARNELFDDIDRLEDRALERMEIEFSDFEDQTTELIRQSIANYSVSSELSLMSRNGHVLDADVVVETYFEVQYREPTGETCSEGDPLRYEYFESASATLDFFPNQSDRCLVAVRLRLPYVIENTGNAAANVQMIRFYSKDVFPVALNRIDFVPCWSDIAEYPCYYTLNQDAIEPHIFPGNVSSEVTFGLTIYFTFDDLQELAGYIGDHEVMLRVFYVDGVQPSGSVSRIAQAEFKIRISTDGESL
ncbi:MAG: hypothetical protein GVY36_19300 [Verrucomicrobia bacterium]|jgi:hypothetical protein|nr:hypothetical protein [Verrucomicrobiota bacterium]